MSTLTEVEDAPELPTLRDFLRNGVMPCPQPSDQTMCAVCHCDFTNPIEIQACGHIFDFECLSSWFASSSKPTTCPMCRRHLFVRNDLAEILARFSAPGFEMDTFDIPQPVAVVVPDIGPSSGLLIPLVLSVDEDLMTTIDVGIVTTALVLAGNIEIVVSEVHESPMGSRELADFRHILKAVYDFMLKKDGSSMSVQSLPIAILNGVQDVLRSQGSDVGEERYSIDDISELDDHPAKRAVRMAFFIAWVLWRRSDQVGEDANADTAV
ncbi:unnamed protein product [Zymoseptoria tritici ST99CH_1A5]|nr:unnamed protein product [Zymoseptoria tritici ST99CH_1E4]SMY25976.1 unnamed protein product [Zymoseptoria tritici ST99CH_1A5]